MALKWANWKTYGKQSIWTWKSSRSVNKTQHSEIQAAVHSIRWFCWRYKTLSIAKLIFCRVWPGKLRNLQQQITVFRFSLISPKESSLGGSIFFWQSPVNLSYSSRDNINKKLCQRSIKVPEAIHITIFPTFYPCHQFFVVFILLVMVESAFVTQDAGHLMRWAQMANFPVRCCLLLEILDQKILKKVIPYTKSR